ncbi:MAG: hypothetical protein ACUVWP_03690 [bacterium]
MLRKIISFVVTSFIMFIFGCQNDTIVPNLSYSSDNNLYEEGKGTLYIFYYPQDFVYLENPENPGEYFPISKYKFPVFVMAWHSEDTFGEHLLELLCYKNTIPFDWDFESYSNPYYITHIRWQFNISKKDKINEIFDPSLWEEHTRPWEYTGNYPYFPYNPYVYILLAPFRFHLKEN